MNSGSMHPLLINEAPLQVLPSLANTIGLNEALILQQIHYWINPKHNQNLIEGRHWVYNTYEQWQEQFPFWCTKTICRTISNLERIGLLNTFVTQRHGPVKHYTINYDALDKLHTQSTSKPADTLLGQEEEEEEEEEVDEETQEMLDCWNDIVQRQLTPGQATILTPKREIGLTAIASSFAKQGLSWRNYCNKIANTRFLMGDNTSGFKVTLDWALNLNNACKVLEGAIYDRQANTPINTPKATSDNDWDSISEEIKAYIPQNAYIAGWLKACAHLFKSLGGPDFRSWFVRVSLISVDGNTAILQAEHNFMKDWIYNHYRDQLIQALRTVYPAITDIKVEVASCSR